MTDVTLLVGDRGKTVVAHVGNRVVIRLAENPTTGYVWEMGNADSRLIEIKGSDYQESPGSGVGRGGTRLFSLQAKAPGTVPLLLKLRRPWEAETEVADRFSVTLIIQ
ncbi:MAG: protease inhibitor I42 family protein [Cyanobacteria bacterium REEB459]|nr:protease inhibitor I42 family protein [Cyanobacteria bacterium REEB459]